MLETLNTGKALRESCYDVDDVIKVFRYYADLADKETDPAVDARPARMQSRKSSTSRSASAG